LPTLFRFDSESIEAKGVNFLKLAILQSVTVSIVIQCVILQQLVAISVPCRIGPMDLPPSLPWRLSGFNLGILTVEAKRIWAVVAVEVRLDHAYPILTHDTTGGSLLLQLATTCSVPLESCGENVELAWSPWLIT
jgi:hypothetical protein